MRVALTSNIYPEDKILLLYQDNTENNNTKIIYNNQQELIKPSDILLLKYINKSFESNKNIKVNILSDRKYKFEGLATRYQHTMFNESEYLLYKWFKNDIYSMQHEFTKDQNGITITDKTTKQSYIISPDAVSEYECIDALQDRILVDEPIDDKTYQDKLFEQAFNALLRTIEVGDKSLNYDSQKMSELETITGLQKIEIIKRLHLKLFYSSDEWNRISEEETAIVFLFKFFDSLIWDNIVPGYKIEDYESIIDDILKDNQTLISSFAFTHNQIQEIKKRAIELAKKKKIIIDTLKGRKNATLGGKKIERKSDGIYLDGKMTYSNQEINMFCLEECISKIDPISNNKNELIIENIIHELKNSIKDKDRIKEQAQKLQKLTGLSNEDIQQIIGIMSVISSKITDLKEDNEIKMHIVFNILSLWLSGNISSDIKLKYNEDGKILMQSEKTDKLLQIVLSQSIFTNDQEKQDITNTVKLFLRNYKLIKETKNNGSFKIGDKTVKSTSEGITVDDQIILSTEEITIITIVALMLKNST